MSTKALKWGDFRISFNEASSILKIYHFRYRKVIYLNMRDLMRVDLPQDKFMKIADYQIDKAIEGYIVSPHSNRIGAAE